MGSGPIGILLAQSCKALGAAQVLITDISDARLELARSCGADFAVNTRTRNFGKVMVECFGPDKADVIYDCAGNDTTMGQAIQYARKGSKLVWSQYTQEWPMWIWPCLMTTSWIWTAP